MPKFFEDILKRRYGADSSIPYKIMNARDYMRGNKETAKGRALQRKHNRDVRAGRARSQRGKRRS